MTTTLPTPSGKGFTDPEQAVHVPEASVDGPGSPCSLKVQSGILIDRMGRRSP